MCSTSSSPRNGYRDRLPRTEPCFVYLSRSVDGQMPDFDEEICGNMIAKVFPEEFEHQVVMFLITAGFRKDDLTEREEFEWVAVNWGIIDRLIGTWVRNRKWPARLKGLRSICGIRSHGAREMEIAMRKHLFLFTRETAVREIRAAIDRLVRSGVIAKTCEEVENHGPMIFYAPQPELIHRLARASTT